MLVSKINLYPCADTAGGVAATESGSVTDCKVSSIGTICAGAVVMGSVFLLEVFLYNQYPPQTANAMPPINKIKARGFCQLFPLFLVLSL